MAGAGLLPAQHRTSDISQKAPRLKLEPQFSSHISYDTHFGINAGGVVVRVALQYAWDSQFDSFSANKVNKKFNSRYRNSANKTTMVKSCWSLGGPLEFMPWHYFDLMFHLRVSALLSVKGFSDRVHGMLVQTRKLRRYLPMMMCKSKITSRVL
jgi:hypothetical protein